MRKEELFNMMDKNKISEINHRIAIRCTINCIWKQLLLTIIVALIDGSIAIAVSMLPEPEDGLHSELIIFIISAIVYILLTTYWIVKAIRKNYQATQFDRSLKNENKKPNT